jgi:rare lipoprotein A
MNDPRTRLALRHHSLARNQDSSARQLTAWCNMKTLLLWTALFLAGTSSAVATHSPVAGVASWYGEDHRGRLMANRTRFNPDRPTAASWFYPLGTKVRVTVNSANQKHRSVLVTITDRGPAKGLVHDGRIIDLTRAAFKQLASPQRGLVGVTVQPIK